MYLAWFSYKIELDPPLILVSDSDESSADVLAVYTAESESKSGNHYFPFRKIFCHEFYFISRNILIQYKIIFDLLRPNINFTYNI